MNFGNSFAPFSFPYELVGKYVYINIKKKKKRWSYLIYSSFWNCASGSEIPSGSHVVTRGQRLLSISSAPRWHMMDLGALLFPSPDWRDCLGTVAGPWQAGPSSMPHLDQHSALPPESITLGGDKAAIYSSIYFFIWNQGGWCGRRCRLLVIMM